MNSLVKFDKIAKDINQFVAPCLEIKVADDETKEAATGAGRNIKDYLKKVEDRRKELVGPLNEEVKAINDYAKKISEPLNKASTYLKSELVVFEKQLEKIRAEAQKKADADRHKKELAAAAELKAKQEEAEMAAAFSDDPEEQESIAAEVQVESVRVAATIQQEARVQEKAIAANKVSGVKKVWTFEVIDPLLVPRRFLKVDETEIRNWIRASEENRTIPGVNIFQDTQIAFR